jgi:tetratricopeptide (TPR) repeat protein
MGIMDRFKEKWNKQMKNSIQKMEEAKGIRKGETKESENQKDEKVAVRRSKNSLINLSEDEILQKLDPNYVNLSPSEITQLILKKASLEEYAVFSDVQKIANPLYFESQTLIKNGEYDKGIELAKEALSFTKFEAESIYWSLGDAYWRKAKETGMNEKNVNDDAWRNLNEAILYWIQALPLPAALRDISKAYRFRARVHYNKRDIKTAIEIYDAIYNLEKKYNTTLLTKNDKKLLEKWNKELEQ